MQILRNVTGGGNLETSRNKCFSDLCEKINISHFDFIRLNKFQRVKKAFTLAEVLITLGIIGVVAAMTIPTLMNRTNDIHASTAVKKFYSTMKQAIQLSEVFNGECSTWVKGEEKVLENGERDFEQTGETSVDFFNTYLAPYINKQGVIKGRNRNAETGVEADNPKIYFSDGTSIAMHNAYFGYQIAFYTVDKNITPRNAFSFMFVLDKNQRETLCGSKNISFCPYGDGVIGNTREEKLEKCKQLSVYCASLLMYDNWEFKKDFPY